MFRYLFRQKNTRGPVLGIIVITVFVAIGLSLLVSVNNRDSEAEAGADTNLPNVVDQVDDRDRYLVTVENQTIEINASSPNERMRIVVAEPEPVVEAPAEEPVAKQEAPTATPAPAPQNPEVIQAPTDTSFGNDQAEAAAAPPTATPLPAPVVVADLNHLIAYVDHTVSAGETIYRLTVLYNTSVTMLSEAGISEYDMVPGKVLTIPFANNKACASQRAYAIREGDTLYRIGVNKGTTAVILQQINGIDANYLIDAGSALCLP